MGRYGIQLSLPVDWERGDQDCLRAEIHSAPPDGRSAVRSGIRWSRRADELTGQHPALRTLGYALERGSKLGSTRDRLDGRFRHNNGSEFRPVLCLAGDASHQFLTGDTLDFQRGGSGIGENTALAKFVREPRNPLGS